MAVSVRLDFMPPTLPDIAALHIEEAPEAQGIFQEIDRVTDIGSFPSYISYYTTFNATNLNYWFRIRWETTQGVFTPYSQVLQGGTRTLVQEIVDRVMLRNPSLNEIIVTQEAQAVISGFYGVPDPNLIQMSEATYIEIRGITNMTLARSLISTYLASGGTVSKYTAGLVSLQSGATTADPTKAIEALITAANDDLGLRYSVVLLMKECDGLGSGYCAPQGQLQGIDLSRTLMTDFA
jgi:hypothetical protein